MEHRESSLNFPKTEDSGPQTAMQTLVFPRRVLRAGVGMSGYSATFENREDHHLGRLTVEVNARINSSDETRVDVSGTFGLRDWSGNFDDAYSGNIQFVVVAELDAITPPSPGDFRGDLLVVDAEVTQAIQHFRSNVHLDAVNVFPDNSIRLVADKPTVIRLYVDYDAGSGLPTISQLSGELSVSSGGSTTILTPLEPIVPRRDNAVDRDNRRHTLNFLIPENLCNNTITISARVFQTTDSTQFSQPFERDLTFDTLPNLPIMAIGIEYTGPDTQFGDLTAPVLSDFVDTFAFTEKVYPIPEFVISSYQTITYDKEVKSDISEGCDKLDDLKDAIKDMRGDSDDIVYGLFNTGVDTGSVGGCGGGRAAVGRIGRGSTAAHEIGHALGRKHAPCDNVTRCAQPRNTDDDYPVYSGYDSDSIGEYGFDPTGGVRRVFNPATVHDFMGYSGSKWISPYTYKALMSRIPEKFPTSAAFAPTSATGNATTGIAVPPLLLPDNEWIPIKQQKLFLRLDIHRDRSVTFQPAFHFPALPRANDGEATDFVTELLDKKGRVLMSECLTAEGIDCGRTCNARIWPLRIRQAIAFHLEATKLVLYECDKEIGAWPIPAPPEVRVRVEGAESNDTHFTIYWELEACSPENDSQPWYLIQWNDGRGTWRGAAPRTQDTNLRIPKILFGRLRRAQIRVLATSGIATGKGSWEGAFLPPKTDDGPIKITLPGIPTEQPGSHALPAVLRAVVELIAGKTHQRPELRWYDSAGAELARGRSLDLRRLPVGEHLLTATVIENGEGSGAAQWLVERTPEDRFLLHRGDRKKQPKSPPCDKFSEIEPSSDHSDDHHNDNNHYHNPSHED